LILITIFAGGNDGLAYWLVAMPVGMLKSRPQIAPEGTFSNGICDVLTVLMKEKGPVAPYKGVVPVMLQAFPARLACFICFVFCMRFLNFLAPNY
jgi:solute carrier family 25 carnitine/acylcarnitine transporter 20/29